MLQEINCTLWHESKWLNVILFLLNIICLYTADRFSIHCQQLTIIKIMIYTKLNFIIIIITIIIKYHNCMSELEF